MLRPQSSTYRRWTSALATPASRQIEAITITTTRRLMESSSERRRGSGLAPRVGAMLGRRPVIYPRGGVRERGRGVEAERAEGRDDDQARAERAMLEVAKAAAAAMKAAAAAVKTVAAGVKTVAAGVKAAAAAVKTVAAAVKAVAAAAVLRRGLRRQTGEENQGRTDRYRTDRRRHAAILLPSLAARGLPLSSKALCACGPRCCWRPCSSSVSPSAWPPIPLPTCRRRPP